MAGVADRRFSLREQLTILVIVAVFGAVFLATSLFAAREVSQYSDERFRELHANAVVFAATIADPVRQRDERRTLEALRAISGLPHIRHIRVDFLDGEGFVELGDTVAIQIPESRGLLGDLSIMTARSISAEAPVIHGGEKIGILTLSADTSELGEKISEILWDSLVAALFSATVALLIALRMQRGVTAPITDLVSLMRKVRETDDFGARAKRKRHDETGELVDAFNDMLDKIQDRDARLLAQQENLQKTVMQRTQELKLAKEAAEAANNAKSEFLAVVSHEIRTPMNGLLVMAELINSSELPPRQKRYAEVIVRSGKSLLTIINDILDFSKIEAGKLDLESIPLRPADIISDVISLFWERAKRDDVDLVSHIGAGVPDSIEGDPVRLSQVLSNLVNNALKFTKQGSVIVSARRRTSMTDVVTIEFSVVDTGIGIPPDKLGSIFEAFSQADQSTTRRFGGTGLGLAICRRLVEAMGGEIGVESREGKGSRFYFTLTTRQIAAPRAFPRALAEKRAIVAISGAATPFAVARYLEEAGIAAQLVPINDLSKVDLSYADIILGSPSALAIVHARSCEGHDGWTPARVCVSDLGDNAPDRLLSDGVAEDLLIKPITRQDMIALVERLNEGRLRGAAALQSLRAMEIKTKTFAGARILAADDSAVNREVVREALGRLGVDVTLATNGAEAVEAIEKGAFDLVLMDCSMPVMDGYAAAAAIRKLSDPARARIPIIALTAHVDGEKKAWQQAGMNDFLTKPFTLAALSEAIGLHLTPTGLVAEACPRPTVKRDFVAFDRAALANLAEMSSSSGPLALRALALFETHVRECLNRMAAAFKAADAKEVASAAHALKSASFNVGAKALGEAAARVERSAENFQALPPHLKNLHAAYRKTLDELPTVRENLSHAAA
jgi:two-component system sensor histidine kinase BarA